MSDGERNGFSLASSAWALGPGRSVTIDGLRDSRGIDEVFMVFSLELPEAAPFNNGMSSADLNGRIPLVASAGLV